MGQALRLRVLALTRAVAACLAGRDLLAARVALARGIVTTATGWDRLGPDYAVTDYDWASEQDRCLATWGSSK